MLATAGWARGVCACLKARGAVACAPRRILYRRTGDADNYKSKVRPRASTALVLVARGQCRRYARAHLDLPLSGQARAPSSSW
ncbi:uncharacterized protein BXZ73DRAFT_102492 [Epithele typhae]|uniref:uncharacterized protein n=1 Tax=Epithele typhae TaxID=378194 RepID=UPI00200857F4|nr:uncharacterized protein BXZ73DRAFT_102492 [Epithele typhae]KAH9927984.1 hypothetical protein BXZ73DRAFT_102492 [Epithele typhae]